MEKRIKGSHAKRRGRREYLGLRFMAHGARAYITQEWCELSTNQLDTVRKRYDVPAESPRGPSLTSYEEIFETEQGRLDAGLLICLCRRSGVIPDVVGPVVAKNLPGVERGERLCTSLEIMRVWSPDTCLGINEAVMLVIACVNNRSISLELCGNCHSAMLVDRLGAVRNRCGLCAPTGLRAKCRDARGR